MTYTDPEMTVFEDQLFLAATPDLEINCTYNGPDLVEKRCSATVIADAPNVDDYQYIDMCNDNIVLKMTNPYYSEIQGQLAESKRSYCDLFISSFKRNLTVLVNYNRNCWEELLSNPEEFWKKFIAKELFTKKLIKKKDRIVDEYTLAEVSKPAINPNILDSVNNLHTDEILHTGLNVSTEL